MQAQRLQHKAGCCGPVQRTTRSVVVRSARVAEPAVTGRQQQADSVAAKPELSASSLTTTSSMFGRGSSPAGPAADLLRRIQSPGANGVLTSSIIAQAANKSLDEVRRQHPHARKSAALSCSLFD